MSDDLTKIIEAHLARITGHLDAERKAIQHRLDNISPAFDEKRREKLRRRYISALADIDAREGLLTFDYLYRRAVALHPERSLPTALSAK